MKTTLAALLAALLPTAVMAQNASRADPLDAKAATAPLIYRSVFTGYKTLAAESPPLAWRDANDAVERIGGWRAYAREAAAPAAPSPTPAAPSATPAASSTAPAASAPTTSAPPPEPRATRPATPVPGHRH